MITDSKFRLISDAHVCPNDVEVRFHGDHDDPPNNLVNNPPPPYGTEPLMCVPEIKFAPPTPEPPRSLNLLYRQDAIQSGESTPVYSSPGTDSPNSNLSSSGCLSSNSMVSSNEGEHQPSLQQRRSVPNVVIGELPSDLPKPTPLALDPQPMYLRHRSQPSLTNDNKEDNINPYISHSQPQSSNTVNMFDPYPPLLNTDDNQEEAEEEGAVGPDVPLQTFKEDDPDDGDVVSSTVFSPRMDGAPEAYLNSAEEYFPDDSQADDLTTDWLDSECDEEIQRIINQPDDDQSSPPSPKPTFESSPLIRQGDLDDDSADQSEQALLAYHSEAVIVDIDDVDNNNDLEMGKRIPCARSRHSRESSQSSINSVKDEMVLLWKPVTENGQEGAVSASGETMPLSQKQEAVPDHTAMVEEKSLRRRTKSKSSGESNDSDETCMKMVDGPSEQMMLEKEEYV